MVKHHNKTINRTRMNKIVQYTQKILRKKNFSKNITYMLKKLKK